MDSSRSCMVARAFAVAGFCAAGLFGSGCATVVNGRTQAVTVTSEPAGARVFIESQLVGVTPGRAGTTPPGGTRTSGWEG